MSSTEVTWGLQLAACDKWTVIDKRNDSYLRATGEFTIATGEFRSLGWWSNLSKLPGTSQALDNHSSIWFPSMWVPQICDSLKVLLGYVLVDVVFFFNCFCLWSYCYPSQQGQLCRYQQQFGCKSCSLREFLFPQIPTFSKLQNEHI